MKATGLFFGFFLIGWATALTSDEYETIRWTIIKALRTSRAIQPTIVRLSFHDCVSGCDGCINLDNDSNNGLGDAIDWMEDVYTEILDQGITVTRADFWALGGRAAAEFGMEHLYGHNLFVNGETNIDDFVTPFATFKYGREDCDSAPYTEEVFGFPSPHMTADAMMTYFEETFGMSKEETAAIMGAHTLGNLDQANSGYSGNWLIDPEGVLTMKTTFDNSFYSFMMNSDYTYTGRNRAGRKAVGEDARPQYKCTDPSGTDCGRMLNTDFEVFYNMDLDEDDFLSQCDVSAAAAECAHSDTYDLAVQYASDNALWLADYAKAYDVMTAKTTSTLTEISS